MAQAEPTAPVVTGAHLHHSFLTIHIKGTTFFQDVVSAVCSSGTPNHHGVIRTRRITGWELNAKIVNGIANEDLKMTW